MINNKQLQQLMDKPMSRKEFLRNIGLVVLSLFGANALLSLLLKENSKPSRTQQIRPGRGFGGGRYGV